MRILRAAENRAMPWKNGDGTTYEIAVFPENSTVADFDWRISRALVSKPGPFSIFPGIDRSLSILSGKLALARGGDELIDLSPDSTPYSFPGEDRISGSPSGDLPVVDFNPFVPERLGPRRFEEIDSLDLLAAVVERDRRDRRAGEAVRVLLRPVRFNAETSDSIEKRIPLFDPMAYPMMW